MRLDHDIALALRLADAAGATIRPHFRSGLASERKGDASPVTIADRAAEEAMRRILTAEAPRDGIAGEEFGYSEGTSGRQWVLDPIDGTTGFLAGRPLFGTLIALLVEGWPVLGIIDQPILGERWLGAEGTGDYRHHSADRGGAGVEQNPDPVDRPADRRSDPPHRR